MSILKSLGKFAFEAAKSEISNRAKKVRLASEAVPITQDNMYSLKVGDFVRDTPAEQFYMVLRPKTTTDDGVLAILNVTYLEWYYRLTYCPYSKTISDDGGCRIKTDAYNRSEGKYNTELIMDIYRKLESEEHDPWGCPPPINKFPAFDFVHRLRDNAYVPAIEELYELFINADLKRRLIFLINKCQQDSIPEDENIKIWSSTDNNNPNRFDEDALSIMIGPNITPIVQSIRKAEKAYVIPFKKF